GRDDGFGGVPGTLSSPSHQGARHSHRFGRIRGADQRFRRRSRPRASQTRCGHAEEGPRGAAGVRNYGHPLDATAGFSLDALPIAVKALLDDPNVGMLFISFPMSYAGVAVAFNKGMADSPKPKVMVALGDTWPLPPDIVQAVKESPAVFSRSSDRMLRAITL